MLKSHPKRVLIAMGSNASNDLKESHNLLVDALKSLTNEFITNANNPPNFSVDFFKEQKNISNINCFSDEGNKWEKSNVTVDDNILKIKFRDKFYFRRGRINCSLNDNNIWRWFGVQFTVKQ